MHASYFVSVMIDRFYLVKAVSAISLHCEETFFALFLIICLRILRDHGNIPVVQQHFYLMNLASIDDSCFNQLVHYWWQNSDFMLFFLYVLTVNFLQRKAVSISLSLFWMGLMNCFST